MPEKQDVFRAENVMSKPDSPRGHRKITSAELIRELHRTVDGIAEDGISRGDLKLLSRSLRELRVAFRFFDTVRNHPKVTVFGSARTPEDSPVYRQAVDFGREMARLDWFVITGAGDGVMKAAHEGAGRDRSIGLNILLPFEQSENTIIAGSPNLIQTKYFFTRKLLFLKESHAIALFPGGFGTLDEAFETLTLLQTGKTHPLPLVLVDEPGGDYWTTWANSIKDSLLRHNLISSEDLSLFRIVESVSEAVEEIQRFYRVFHSSRYVGNRFVFRLKRPLAPEELATLNSGFADLLSEGVFSQEGPLPEESNEHELAHLSRLVFNFNNLNFGRLRLLIDHLNR
ncbi:MAG: LOG family protein [Syntrophorhabdaceae bacterium]|nr:LOG family protein [Syntrophorhabdaceae bacterium]